MRQRVGIESLAVAVPHRYLDLEDLARARGVDPAKYTQGLGAKQMAVAEPGEDAAALAATAAKRLIENNSLDPANLGMLVVGTETGVDHSKAVASYVQGMLKLPRGMRTFDVQHACYGGTAGLMAAAEWIASGAAAGRSAIVIASDIARYELNSPGEPTQGGGAVALLVSAEPDLLELDFGMNGVFSMDVHDFWRPLGRREAVVDGHYSIACYLEALSGAYRGWRERAIAREMIRPKDLPSEQLARVVYHVPFCKMAKKAHAQVRRCDIEDTRGVTWNEALDAQEAPAMTASFEKQVASTLGLCAQVGNAYTASLYLGIAGLLEKEAAALEGERIGLFSYGSGCCGEFFSGVVGKKAAQKMAAAKLGNVLAQRERIRFDEYERVLKLPPGEPLQGIHAAPGTFRYCGSQDFRRVYAAG